MSESEQDFAARLAALEAEAARRGQAEAGAQVPPAAPRPSEMARRQLDAQDAARAVRAEATEEADRRYQAQLAETRERRERLEQELLDLAEERRVLELDHRAKLEPIAKRRDAIRAEFDELMRQRVTPEDVLAEEGPSERLHQIGERLRDSMPRLIRRAA